MAKKMASSIFLKCGKAHTKVLKLLQSPTYKLFAQQGKTVIQDYK